MAGQQQELEAIFTVASTFPPKGSAKNGLIRAVDGVEYRALPNMIAMLVQGGTYRATYTTNEFQGKMYNMVSAIRPVDTPMPQGNGGYVPRASAPIPQPAPSIPQPAPSAYQPKPQGHNTAKDIFVCGAFNNLCGAGKIDPNDGIGMAQVVQRLMTVWDRTLGAPPGASTTAAPRPAPVPAPKPKPVSVADPDLDDEIPF